MKESKPPKVVTKKSRGPSPLARPWTAEDDALLRTLFTRGAMPKKIAANMKRSLPAIYARLNFLGLGARTPTPAVMPLPEPKLAAQPPVFEGRSIVDQANEILRQAGKSANWLMTTGLDERMVEANRILKKQKRPLLGRKPEWIPVDNLPKA
jgi:hypothetical protein